VTARNVVEQALAALRNVQVPVDVARSTRDAAVEIDRAWSRAPYVAGLDGNLVARSELVNTIVGERVLDPFRRALGSAPLRLKRGDVMRYRVLRSDDSVDDVPMPERETRDDDPNLDRRATAAREDLRGHEAALAIVEKKLPRIVRHRPAPWAIWLWPLYWVLGVVHRTTIAAWRRDQKLVSDAASKLGALEGFVAARDQRERAARETYYSVLRELCGGGPAGTNIREIELTIPSGIPDSVELVELMGELRASADIDAVILVDRDGLYAPTPAGSRVQLGPVDKTIAELPTVLARARALTLARRALAKLNLARAEIESELERAETELRGRIQRIAKLALPSDKARFHAQQLDRVKPMVVASVNAVMEHASVHLGSELAQLSTEWIVSIAQATTADELKTRIAKIEEAWPSTAKRIADEVRVLVMGGAGGVARDLYTEVVSVLRAHGMPEEHLRTPKHAPEVTPVAILGAMANPATFTLGSGNWLTGLFKSFDAKKADVREKLHARVEHIREVAAAELLDAEPKLHAAVTQALGIQLDTAIGLQQLWHQEALAHEHEAVAKEREALAPLAKSRDAIIATGNQLAQLANAVQAEQPAVAAAAVAAAS
jgi:hypothetical protein